MAGAVLSASGGGGAAAADSCASQGHFRCRRRRRTCSSRGLGCSGRGNGAGARRAGARSMLDGAAALAAMAAVASNGMGGATTRPSSPSTLTFQPWPSPYRPMQSQGATTASVLMPMGTNQGPHSLAQPKVRGSSREEPRTTVQAAGSPLLRPLLLGGFIFIDVAQALVMDWAEKRTWDKTRTGPQYARQTALVVESALSLITGLAVSLFLGGWEGVRSCFSCVRFLRFLPVALCFTVGLSMKMMAVNHFHAGTIKIFGQARLPLTAVFSTLLLGRWYSSIQWQVIGMITMSCMCFVVMKGQSRASKGKSWAQWAGLFQIVAWLLLNVNGGLLAERSYKARDAPYYVQKVSQDIGHLLIGLVMLFVVVPRFKPGENILDRERRPGGFFDSWDVRTCMVVLTLIVDAWISNALLKEFSSVTRSITKAAGVSVVYFASLRYAKERKGNTALTLVALMVVQSSVLYACVS